MKFTDTIKNKAYQFLKNSEKYTKTDNIYLVKGGFWLGIIRVVSTGGSFLLAVVYANFLDPTTFGNYKYLLSLAAAVLMFSLPGMGTALTNAVARGFEGGFYKILKLKIKYSLLGSLTALILAAYYFLKGNNLLPIPLLVISLLFPFFHAFKIYGSFLTGRKLFKISSQYVSFNRLVSSLILVLGVILLKQFNVSTSLSLIALIAIYFFIPTFVNFIVYSRVKKDLKPNKKEDGKTITYGKHLSLMGVIGSIVQRLDQILIFHYLGAIELAIYSFAIYPIEEITSFLNIIPSLAFPKFSQRTKKELKKTFFKRVFQSIILSFVLMIIYIILAPLFYKLFLPNYSNSVLYSQVFAISLLIPTALPVIAFDSQLAIKERYISTIFSKIAKIFFMFFLVLSYGIWGIIIARIIVPFLSFLLSLWLVKKL